MDVADHKNVAGCWNCNRQDLAGKGLEHNFNLVKGRFGATCHVRELDGKNYPYPELVKLLVKMDDRDFDDAVVSLREQPGRLHIHDGKS